MASRAKPNPGTPATPAPDVARLQEIANREPPATSFTVFDPLCSVFRRKLKAEGLKYTPERAQILDTVIRLGDAKSSQTNGAGLFEAERVLSEVRQGGFRVSKATVYRTIRLLQEAGIIQRVPFDDEQSHYQVVYGTSAHDLVIRLDTREAISIDVPEVQALREAVCKRLGLTARGHRLHIFADAGG